jgi:heterodisulfide reductase subunit A-like polyferredoxin
MKGTNNVLVVGGGVAGLSAAETLADFGWQVLLIEQQGHLGGHSHHWACMATETCNRCSACAVCDRLRRVTSNPRIRVRTQARLVKLDGTEGAFEATIEPTENAESVCRSHPHFLLTAPESVSLAKVVIATGFTPFDPAELPLLNYERFGAVMTIADVDEYILQNRLSEFITDAENRVAFIQCVGSRDRERGRDYCSQFCCKASVRLARKLLFERPDLKITIYYIDLQVGGKEFRTFFEEMQGKVRFVQGTPAEILPAEEGPGLRVKAFNPEIDQVVYETHDRVVLAIGQTPGPGTRRLAERLGLALGSDGFLALAEPGISTCSSRPGVYLAGACCGPTDSAGSCLQAMAVAAEIGRPTGTVETARPLFTTGSYYV